MTNDNRLRKERTRSKFDFSNTFYDQSTAWTLDSQYGWDSAPAYDQTAWGDSFEPEVRHKARFSHKDNEEGPTFRLNFEIPDKPIFSEVVDYASIRDRPIVPTAEDIFENSVDDFLEEEASERKRLQPLPNVPINRVKGAYGNVEQYLYTHFELMRRDCLIPLQEAVRSYRRSLASGKDSSVAAAMGEEPVSSRDFRLYEQVGTSKLAIRGNQRRECIFFICFFNIGWAQCLSLWAKESVLSYHVSITLLCQGEMGAIETSIGRDIGSTFERRLQIRS